MVQYRRTHPLAAAELESIGELLERRRRWAERMGAKFLFVIAPDKSTIYSDLVPERFNRLEGPSATDQIVAYLCATTQLEVLDLRGKLIALAAENVRSTCCAIRTGMSLAPSQAMRRSPTACTRCSRSSSRSASSG